MKRSLKIAAWVGTIVLLVVGGWLAWLKYAPRRTPVGQPSMARLDKTSLQAFRDTFNAHQDEVRVLALLSPT